MNLTAAPRAVGFLPQVYHASAKELFRERFQRSLRSCLSRGFLVEEAFGVIWNETSEDIPLEEYEQVELYPELIKWAKATRI